MNHFIRKLIDAILKKLNLIRKSEAELALAAARTCAEAEAERLAEEHKWKIEAALEAERKQLEWEKGQMDLNWVELKAYARTAGIPLLEERPFH